MLCNLGRQPSMVCIPKLYQLLPINPGTVTPEARGGGKEPEGWGWNACRECALAGTEINSVYWITFMVFIFFPICAIESTPWDFHFKSAFSVPEISIGFFMSSISFWKFPYFCLCQICLTSYNIFDDSKNLCYLCEILFTEYFSVSLDYYFFHLLPK